MKKVVLGLLLGIVVISSLCACNNETKIKETKNVETTVEETMMGKIEETGGLIGGNIVNPLVEVDGKYIADKYGVNYKVLDGASDIKYFEINKKMGEYRFTLDDISYNARVKKTDGYEDISGLYYNWDVVDDYKFNNYNGFKGYDGKSMRYIGEDKTIDLCLWYDDTTKLMHSFSATGKDLDGFDVIALVNQVYGFGN